MLKVLIVDDEEQNRTVLTEMLKRLKCDVSEACNGRIALDMILHYNYDLVLTDVRMPQLDGFQLFEAVLHAEELQHHKTSFAFMTAYGQFDDAVAMMRKGALHFLTKPLKKKDLQNLISEVEKLKTLRHESKDKNISVTGAVVYCSRAMGEVVSIIDRVAATTASVLLVGESGTGKEVLAYRLHNQSARAHKPFVAVNAAALSQTLLESELFGHEKGAFTGADKARLGQIRAAHGGTFFLDEVGSMPLEVQAKLLRVIQEKKVLPLGATHPVDCDVRWVAAANHDLDALVVQGLFRSDLLYRLKVIMIEVPPLRQRVEDVDVLLEHFCSEFAHSAGRTLSIPEDTRALLKAYRWPGNVRELRNILERAFALSTDGIFHARDLPPHFSDESLKRQQYLRVTVGSSLETVQDALIEETLKMCDGDKARTAQILGVNPRTIYRWLEKRNSISEIES